MYLDNIIKPNDIKELPIEALSNLASEIREKIIDAVSKNGGHLASNLGVVEITLALHYLMDFPEDNLIFDVGHQSYTHKLLTGRGKDFSSLRTTDGLSGFPNPKESDCDIFYEGHASCAIGEGVGLAQAKNLLGEENKIAVVAGDGSLTGGLSFEALNNASELDTNLTIVLNDNEMSISKNVGGISRSLSNLRTSKGYTDLKDDVVRSLERIPGLGQPLVETIRRTKSGIKQMIIPGMFFEDMGIMYLGPVDGHDIEALIKILRQAFRYKGACVVHAITKKGSGYAPAMKYPSRFHGTGPFDKETGKIEKKTKPDYTDCFASCMKKLAESDDKICAITAAMAEGTGLKSFEERFPGRFFDVGIAEGHAVVLAAALASRGFIPVVAIYSTFLQRSYDQLMMDVCLNRLHVVFAIDRAGLVGSDGATHHGVFDISYLSTMPGMTIMAPKNKRELTAMFKFAVKAEGAVAIRYPRGEAYQGLSEYKAPVVLGKCEPIYTEGRILLFALGSMVRRAEEVRNILADEGIETSITNARFAKPIDREYLNTAKKYSLIVTLEDNGIAGGFGMQVQNILYEQGYNGRVLKVGIPDDFVEHGDIKTLHSRLGIDAESIASEIKEILKGNT